MSDKPEQEIIVNGDSKSLVTQTGRHPWNNTPLPRIKNPNITYNYRLTVQRTSDKAETVQAVCSDLEELFAFHRQFSNIDYNFVKLERIEATK